MTGRRIIDIELTTGAGALTAVEDLGGLDFNVPEWVDRWIEVPENRVKLSRALRLLAGRCDRGEHPFGRGTPSGGAL